MIFHPAAGGSPRKAILSKRSVEGTQKYARFASCGRVKTRAVRITPCHSAVKLLLREWVEGSDDDDDVHVHTSRSRRVRWQI